MGLALISTSAAPEAQPPSTSSSGITTVGSPFPFSSCLSTLLTAYPDPDEHINAIDPEMNRQTPLHIAAANADPTAVKMLLDAGADARRRDAEGRTAGEVVGGRMKGRENEGGGRMKGEGE